MSTFRTVFPIIPSDMPLQHTDCLFLAGSCFSQHMGARLKAAKFRTTSLPYGIQFHPTAMWEGLERLVEGVPFSDSGLFLHQGLYHHFDFHSVFSGQEKDKVGSMMHQHVVEMQQHLAKADVLLLTFGTSIGYRFKETGQLVNNCHKVPMKAFETEMTALETLIAQGKKTIATLLSAQPSLKIILTVSPVRHLRQGFVENQRSKGRLLLMCEALEAAFPQVHYFPAYELVMDDLRDYRFMEADMVHPNEQAIDYIWSAFAKCFFSSAVLQCIENEITPIQKALAHRPFDENSEGHQRFKAQTLDKINRLKSKYPWMEW